MFWNSFPYSYNFGGFNTPYNCTPGFNSWCSPEQFCGWNGFGGFNGMNSQWNCAPQSWNTPAWNSQSCFGGSCTPWSSYSTPWNYSGQMQNNWGSNWSTPHSFYGSNYDWNCSYPQSFGSNWNQFSTPQFGFGGFPHAWNQGSFGGFDWQNSFGGHQFPYYSQIPFWGGEQQGFGGYPYAYQQGFQQGIPFGGFGMHQYPGYTPAHNGTTGFSGQTTPGGFNPSVVRDAA